MPPGHGKVGVKNLKRTHLSEPPPLHPYEQKRLMQCMQNNARLQELGIYALSRELEEASSISHKKNKPSHKNTENFESEYDPSSQDDTDDDDNAKGSKQRNTKTACKSVGAINLRSKRVLAELECTRNTRSKKHTAQADATLAPSVNIDGHNQATFGAGGPAHLDENTLVADEGHVVAPLGGQNYACNEDNGHVQADGNMTNADEVDDDNNQMLNEDVQLGENDRWERGANMGHGLYRINRALRGKLQVVIPEGKIRPMAPLVAAKFATECNIAVRNHVPVLKHWKEYKKKQGLFKVFTGRLSAKFDINTSDASVQNGCNQMMKNAVRQQRHRLKKKYFNPFPLHLVPKTSPIRSMTDQEWNELVEYWKTPKGMEISQKNKENRTHVIYHQTTGSRSYQVHVENLGDKYNDQEPDALDLFKECHYSKKKKCYSSNVQQAITQMENKLSTPAECEEQMSVTKVVADVLAENTRKNLFLQNVGIQNSCPRSSVRNIAAQLEAEKGANTDLRSVVNTQREQLDLLSKQMQEREELRVREQGEMKKRQAEMEADMKKLQLLLSKIQPS
ncbi:uncharacterized protein LOC112901927 isoform X2 [Panicum hallii]|nr:uncharacterized protein LOC112901927 isoform X2 [Panicum hallii]